SSNGHDRFGIPDEIDTTPREEPVRQPVIESADADAPVATPNAASSPVWSLTVDQGGAAPEAVEEAVEKEETLTVAREQAAPAGPPKKGWWQRTFRGED